MADTREAFLNDILDAIRDSVSEYVTEAGLLVCGSALVAEESTDGE